MGAARKKSNRISYLKKRWGDFFNRINSNIYARRKTAKQRGVEFSITIEDFEEITHCPLLPWSEFCFNNGRKMTDNSPSIDRIDPAKGYTKENTWVISNRANRIKNNATLEEFEEIAKNWRAEVERRKKLNDK